MLELKKRLGKTCWTGTGVRDWKAGCRRMAVGTKARGWGWAGLEAAVEKQRADRPMGPFSLDSVDDGLLRAASRRKLGVRIVGVDGGRMEREAVTAAARDGPSSELATARPLVRGLATLEARRAGRMGLEW